MKTLTAVMVGLLAVPAFAQGVLLSPGQLPADVRGSLASQLEAAKRSDRASFEALARVRAALPTLDAKKRGSRPALSPVLRQLGPKLLYPLTEEAAFSAQPRGELPSSAWQAWRLAVLEVLGEQRMKVASPIFLAVLAKPESDFELDQMAASALGMLGDKASAQALVTLSGGAKRQAVLAGMGSCHRAIIAQTLAQAVSTTTDPRELAQLSKSLGSVGNSWAWRTPGMPAPEEEAAVRSIAARALIEAFVKSDGAARQAASNALMLVDAKETPALIQEAKAIASEPTLKALAGLEQRFAKNPARL